MKPVLILMSAVLALLFAGMLCYWAGPVLAGTPSMPTYTLSWGGAGSTDSKFAAPRGVAVNMSDGNVYVADAGVYKAKWDTGSGRNRVGIGIDSLNFVYVAFSGTDNSIIKYDSIGSYIGAVGGGAAGFGLPEDAAVNRLQTLYTSERGNNLINKSSLTPSAPALVSPADGASVPGTAATFT